MSIGCVVSYKLGACNMIAAVPKTQANAKSHRNKRSRTMATYFQSSSTCEKKIEGHKRKRKKNMCYKQLNYCNSRLMITNYAVKYPI